MVHSARRIAIAFALLQVKPCLPSTAALAYALPLLIAGTGSSWAAGEREIHLNGAGTIWADQVMLIQEAQIEIPWVASMPSVPSPLHMLDWKSVSRGTFTRANP